MKLSISRDGSTITNKIVMSLLMFEVLTHIKIKEVYLYHPLFKSIKVNFSKMYFPRCLVHIYIL